MTKNSKNLDYRKILIAIKDRKLRLALVRESHAYFLSIYLGHYLKFDTADFQKEIIALTEDKREANLVIAAFRGSAKSTIISLSYVLWSVLGRQQKKFVLIISGTQTQARQILRNIRNELETNLLLKNDLGPFRELDNEEWNLGALEIKNCEAKIAVASREQNIRGIRHGHHRPDLVICDDIENQDSVRIFESREKTFEWLTGEIIPAGEENTRLIVIGNLLHDDSLISRLREKIKNNEFAGIFKLYPLIDDNGFCLWSERFTDEQAIDDVRRKIGNETAWQQEFLQKIVNVTNPVIRKEWLRYYDHLPDRQKGVEFQRAAIGVDLAISQKESADYTAMVGARLYKVNGKIKIFIFPMVINERLSSLQAEKMASSFANQVGHHDKAHIFIEKVAYQASLIERLRAQGIYAEGVDVHWGDKRARLETVSPLIESGDVIFPKEGAKKLIQQLLYFGSENHDDIADALVILLLKIQEKKLHRPSLRLAEVNKELCLQHAEDDPLFSQVY